MDSVNCVMIKQLLVQKIIAIFTNMIQIDACLNFFKIFLILGHKFEALKT